MRNTVPLGSVVAPGRAPPSPVPPLSAGNSPVDHTTQASWFGRRDMTFLQISSTAMIAHPVSSCPVTTRLIFNGIAAPHSHLFRRTRYRALSCPPRDFRALHYQTRIDENKARAEM